MGDVASSVLARLKNKAKESGRSYQLCLQMFCQEEFLRRLEKSKYVDNLVLKGGLFIYSLTEFDSRVTVDVDFLLKRIPNTPEQLKRVINNIVSNSLKYMEREHGLINLRVKDVGDFIQVELEDNGKGIAAKDLPNIFDRFYRTDASRNSATGGSGIGLSIVKKIIEDHGGKIWATSKESIGTVMYFVIRKYQEVPNEQSINS